ncbi:MAG: hypothetical protein EBV83_00825 [Verrucomicrobia bacterium]|nr:hypothetical protein [Verrucomicrobiota bacterium]
MCDFSRSSHPPGLMKARLPSPNGTDTVPAKASATGWLPRSRPVPPASRLSASVAKSAANPVLDPSKDPWLPSTRLFPPYAWPEVFGRSAPVEVDLGAGDGIYAEARAQREPERDFVAVERLLGDLARAVRSGGVLKLTTDDADYFQWACAEMARCSGWKAQQDWKGLEEPTSEFEELFKQEGRSVYRRAWGRE